MVTLNHEVRDILERQAEERLVTIICDQQTLNHPYARVSVTHLKRLLLNIAGNAVKYNRRGRYVLPGVPRGGTSRWRPRL